METFVVIPCLNEARNIERTARSLGFGRDLSPPAATTIVLVDNGSSDGTIGVLASIKATCPPLSVIIGEEAERGYVPPRHHGIELARAFAIAQAIELNEVLILQADADTVYEPGYIRSMQLAAALEGSGVLLEGHTSTPARFQQDHPRFQELATLIDTELGDQAVPDEYDVVIDDKVSGYRLADYDAWGGHRREYDEDGHEVHAETTRLYIRALRHGGHRVRVQDAFARPSRRKIQRNPLRHFATAGFPRNDSWWRAWHRMHPGTSALSAFDNPTRSDELHSAMDARRAHVFALFCTVPRIVWTWLGRDLGGYPQPLAGTPAVNVEQAIRFLEADDLGRFFSMLLPAPDQVLQG